MRFLSKFVDSNDRELRRIQPWVDEANSLEAEFEGLSDEEIRTQFAEIRDEVRAAAQLEEPSDDEGGSSDDPAVQGTMGEIGKDPQLDRALELLKSWQVFKTFVAKREG